MPVLICPKTGVLACKTMFEELKLLGKTGESIVVQTRRGTNLRNLVEPEPGEQQRRCIHRRRADKTPHALRRAPERELTGHQPDASDPLQAARGHPALSTGLLLSHAALSSGRAPKARAELGAG